jgi:hypothetical protein
MSFVLQVNLEIDGCHIWSWGVELPGAVETPNARKKKELDVGWYNAACWWH